MASILEWYALCATSHEKWFLVAAVDVNHAIELTGLPPEDVDVSPGGTRDARRMAVVPGTPVVHQLPVKGDYIDNYRDMIDTGTLERKWR